MIVIGLFYIIGAVAYIQGVNMGKRKYMGLLIVFAIACISFAHQPLSSDDLTHEYAALDGIRAYGWSYFSQGSSNYYSSTIGTISSSKFEGLYVSQLMYFLFAHLPIYNFMPALVVGIQFFLEFKLIDKLKKRFDLSNKEIVFVFLTFFFVREIRWMMSGIRFQLAFTIAIYLMYEDLVEKKKRIFCLFGYVLCGMIHQSAYIFIILRFILYIPNKKIKGLIAVLMLFWSNLLDIMFNFFTQFTNVPILNSLLWKLTIYTQNDSGENANVILRPYYVKMMISDIGLLIFSLITVYIFHKLYKNTVAMDFKVSKSFSFNRGVITFHHEKVDEYFGYLNNDFAVFLMLATCLTIGSNMYYWLYLRFAVMVQIALTAVSAVVVSKMREEGIISKRNTYMLVGMAAILLKFIIMMLVANRSFDFNFGGFFPL